MSNEHWSTGVWDRIVDAAEDRGESARVRVWYYNRPEVAFTMEIIDGKPRAVVDEGLLDLLADIDVPALLARLADDGQRANWKRWSAQIQAMRGKTVSLFTATAAVAVPLGAPTRTTLNINVYHFLQVDPASLPLFLSPAEMETVTKLKAAPTFLEIARALGIDTETGEANDGATVPPVLDGAGSLEKVGVLVVPGISPPTKPLDDEPPVEVEEDPLLAQFNVIFFGPPGTGKSYELAELVKKHLHAKDDDVFRVTFHPEYSYFDFVGTYRPAVGWLSTTFDFRMEDARGKTGHEEPRVYYDFAAGPLSEALALAVNQPTENVVLIIEEINRGNCAAIFGDVFQLLDRGSDVEKTGFGESEYDIRPSREWANWLDQKIEKASGSWQKGRLKLPKNLYIYATMNTSDQSLFPMDTAFRRRWSMKYAPVKPKANLPTKVPLRPGKIVFWRDLMVPLNARIVEHTSSDDKQMGPWFVKAPTKNREVTDVEFQSKVLFYLWSEVFRDSPDGLFAPKIRTYDQLLDAYQDGKDIFRPEVYATVEPKPLEVVSEPAASVAEDAPVKTAAE